MIIVNSKKQYLQCEGTALEITGDTVAIIIAIYRALKSQHEKHGEIFLSIVKHALSKMGKIDFDLAEREKSENDGFETAESAGKFFEEELMKLLNREDDDE